MERYNIEPNFNSRLMSILFELESLRGRFIFGDTPSWLFYDLKHTLHLLESLSSARIEGNHTTLIGAINEATKTESKTEDKNEEIMEIVNIQNAIEYIDENLEEGNNITIALVRELHEIVVRGLEEGGSKTPGAFRTENVRIANSECVVSSPQAIAGDMAELIDYINAEHENKDDMIRIACAHHRFVQIHPFDNGNGRVARLLTYAMLVKYGFLRRKKMLLNPSSIFCIDRNKYYVMLAEADKESDVGIEKWCEYVAEGILGEVNKMFKLLDREFAVENLIIPAIRESRKDEHLSEKEYQILMVATEKDIIQAGDVCGLFGVTPSDKVRCSRFLAEMVENGLLFRPPKMPKKYVLRFFNKRLLFYVMKRMEESGMIGEI